MFGVDKDERDALLGFDSSSSDGSSTTADDDVHNTETVESQWEEESSEEEDDDDDESYEGFDDDFEEESTSEHGKNSSGTMQDSFKSPFSSMDTRDRYETSCSHSFASEATEERGHVSSPRNTPKPQRKKILGEAIMASQADIPMTPPTDRRSLVGSGNVTSPSGLSTISAPSTSSTGTNRSPRRMMANRQRVPGGGAAKLIGRRSEDDFQPADDGDDSLEVKPPVDELIKSREIAKAEFSKGSSDNRRYHGIKNPSQATESCQVTQETAMPNVIDRSTVFHENAASAIASLLSPSDLNSPMSSVISNEIAQVLSSQSGDISTKGKNSPKKSKKATPSAFQPPKKVDEVPAISSIKSNASIAKGAQVETVNPLVQQLLSKKLDRRLGVIRSQMKNPNRNMTELMTAIMYPKDGNFNRHYMVRRKNACGALQVMTANASHRVNICWTVGVLPALASVLEDSGPGSLEEAIPDMDTRFEFIEARKRAVAALMNLVVPKDNKLPIFHCPKMVASLIRVINQDDAEARRGCCAVLAHLSKCRDNKLLMVQVPGLLDAITAVIDPKIGAMGWKNSEDQHSSSDDSDAPDIFDRVVSQDDTAENNEEGEKNLERKKTPSEDPAEASARYDEDPNEFLHGARLNVFAVLNHLVKDKDNAFALARHVYLLDTLVEISKLQESSSQHFGLRLLAQFSRHRGNSKLMVFKSKAVVPAIVLATQSNSAESRKYACYALQNFSQDKPCRQELASIENLLSAICRRIRNAKAQDEKVAALHTLKNLTDEPANLIPMTNTPECFATLMQIAHASDDSITETMQYIGCDALATLSHWFRSIATSGQRIGTEKRNDGRRKDELFVPTLRVVTWQAWQ